MSTGTVLLVAFCSRFDSVADVLVLDLVRDRGGVLLLLVAVHVALALAVGLAAVAALVPGVVTAKHLSLSLDLSVAL